jgi:hypothetical protein
MYNPFIILSKQLNFRFDEYYFLFGKIPDMYACTALKDKHIKITILIGGDQERREHPIYQIWYERSRVSSIIIPVNEYSSM